MSEAKRMSEKRLDNIKMWADAGMPVGSVGVIELFQHIAAVESELAAAKQRNADYRDCLEVAGKMAEAVECYDSDDLLEPIVQYLIPVFGEIERLHAELAAAKAECERLRMYREIAEDLISAFLSANEVVLAHFDENDQLRGNGQWRLKEIIKAAKRADQANRKAARAFDAAAGQECDE